MENNRQRSIEFAPILETLMRRIGWVALFAAVGVVVAIIFSKSVTPLYEANSVMYPSNSNSREKQLEDFSFGHEMHAERLMQLLVSATMLDSLEARFSLAAHYGIDKSSADWYDQLQQMAKERITFHKNKYVSVSVSVMDADPEFCAQVANDVSRLVNVINADIVKSSALASLEVVEKEYKRRQGVVSHFNDSILGLEASTTNATRARIGTEMTTLQRQMTVLRDSLDRIRRQYRIHDFSYQMNVLNEHLAEARANFLQEKGMFEVLERSTAVPDSVKAMHEGNLAGAKLRMDDFSAELERLSGINKRYLNLESQLEASRAMYLEASTNYQDFEAMVDPNIESRRLARLEEDFRWDQLQTQELNAKYQKALSNYLDPVPAAIVVSPARPSHRPIYPHTVVNLLLGGLGGLFFALLLFTILDRKRGGAA